jgi:hypothetical protein
MTGQIADQFAQRKIVATDEFLERTTGSKKKSASKMIRGNVFTNLRIVLCRQPLTG